MYEQTHAYASAHRAHKTLVINEDLDRRRRVSAYTLNPEP